MAMMQVNLLPWREHVKQVQKVRFFTLLGAKIGFALLVVILGFFYLDSLIVYHKNRINYLQTELNQLQAKLDTMDVKKKEKIAVAADLEFLLNMSRQSFQLVRLIDGLVKVVPATVSLLKFDNNGKEIIIIGRAKTDLDITLFLKNMGKSPVFKQPVLTEINGKKDTLIKDRDFQLKVEQRD
jgi:type IV pilus assembly protein PilN